jgi:membrane protease subunit HflK
MTIGYEALSRVQDMIWSRPHGRKEYRFPVGDGRELISIDALLYYEIDDVFDYAYQTQNPDTILACLAYAALSERIVGSQLDELLSVDRASLSEELAETLNRRATSESLGLHVVQLCLESIHPPFEVADAYQRVVSSTLAKEARVLRANAYRENVLPAAQAQADSLVSLARADSCLRLGTAKGEAIAFIQTAAARGVAPDLFDQHLRLGTLEASLVERQFVVLDRRISTSRLQPWIDLREKPLSVPLDQAKDDFEDMAIPWEGEGAFQ